MSSVYEEQKKLVLARLNTLNPGSKMMLGGKKDVTVKELIGHVELDDDFGKQIVEAQMMLLKVLAGSA